MSRKSIHEIREEKRIDKEIENNKEVENNKFDTQDKDCTNTISEKENAKPANEYGFFKDLIGDINTRKNKTDDTQGKDCTNNTPKKRGIVNEYSVEEILYGIDPSKHQYNNTQEKDCTNNISEKENINHCDISNNFTNTCISSKGKTNISPYVPYDLYAEDYCKYKDLNATPYCMKKAKSTNKSKVLMVSCPPSLKKKIMAEYKFDEIFKVKFDKIFFINECIDFNASDERNYKDIIRNMLYATHYVGVSLSYFSKCGSNNPDYAYKEYCLNENIVSKLLIPSYNNKIVYELVY